MSTLLALLTYILLSMADVENQNHDPHKANGDCVGVLQLRPIFVKEVNRILGAEVYTEADRESRTKSFKMARVWMTYYLKKHPEWTM